MRLYFAAACNFHVSVHFRSDGMSSTWQYANDCHRTYGRYHESTTTTATTTATTTTTTVSSLLLLCNYSYGVAGRFWTKCSMFGAATLKLILSEKFRFLKVFASFESKFYGGQQLTVTIPQEIGVIKACWKK